MKHPAVPTVLLSLAILAGCASRSPSPDPGAAPRASRYSLPAQPPSNKHIASTLALRGVPDPESILSGKEMEETAGAATTADLAAYALDFLGVPYRYGGSSPEAGFDCSGLVGYVSREVLGLRLPRRAEEMSRVGESVALGELQPGDLVFYNTLRRKFSHVGIYLGDGRFVHAPSSGGVVRIESMDVSYWKKRFNGARRLASAEAASR